MTRDDGRHALLQSTRSPITQKCWCANGTLCTGVICNAQPIWVSKGWLSTSVSTRRCWTLLWFSKAMLRAWESIRQQRAEAGPSSLTSVKKRRYGECGRISQRRRADSDRSYCRYQFLMAALCLYVIILTSKVIVRVTRVIVLRGLGAENDWHPDKTHYKRQQQCSLQAYRSRCPTILHPFHSPMPMDYGDHLSQGHRHH